MQSTLLGTPVDYFHRVRFRSRFKQSDYLRWLFPICFNLYLFIIHPHILLISVFITLT